MSAQGWGARYGHPHSPPGESSPSGPGCTRGGLWVRPQSSSPVSLTLEGQQAQAWAGSILDCFSVKVLSGLRPQIGFGLTGPLTAPAPKTVWVTAEQPVGSANPMGISSEGLPGWRFYMEPSALECGWGNWGLGVRDRDVINDSGLRPISSDLGFPDSRSSYCTKQNGN